MKYYNPPYKLNEIKIEVTHKCPLACVHCSSDAGPTINREIEPEKCIKIIKEAVEMGVKEVVFSGGEPLLWDYLEYAIAFAFQKGISVTIYTSGFIKNVENKLNSLKNAGATKIVFSIFGAVKDVHERITRIPGSFEKTILAAKIAVKLGYNTEFHFVPLQDNYRQLPGITELASKLSISRISILRFVPQGRGYLIRKHMLSYVQNLELKQMILKIRNTGFEVRTGSPYNFLLINKEPTCLSGKDRLVVGPDLRIYPCDAFKNIKAEELVGTLEFSSLDEYSLKECWEKSHFINEIRKYLTTDFVEPCLSCSVLKKCLSGCLAQKVIDSGKLKKRPDPMCIQRKGVPSHG